MKIPRGVALIASSTILAGALGACDSAPGVLENGGTPPVVSGLEYTPTTVVFEDVPPSDVIGDSVVIFDLTVSASVVDDDGDVDSVTFVINDPFDPFEPLTVGNLSRIGTGSRYSASTRVAVARGNSGLYSLIVSAVDANVGVSNQVRGLIEYRLEGGEPPVIVDVAGPDAVTPPTTFTFVATVTDPDGPGNIASVVTRAPNGDTFDLFDDGQQGGDVMAGDGRYTVSFNAPEGTPAGTVQFEFQAFDRQGHESNIVVRDLTVN